MVMTDPIADMLTRIRNANAALHETVNIPASRMKAAVLDILLQEGFVKNVEKEENTLKVTLKYGSNNEKVITGISTSKGVMSDKQARKEGLGGEVIAYVW